MTLASTQIDRQHARDLLDQTRISGELPYAADEWPIAAAMLQFPSIQPDGRSTREAGPEAWRAAFGEIAAYGFRAAEIPSAWLPLGDMSPQELEALRAVLRETGIRPVATSVVRKNIIDPQHGDANLAATHRAIDAAATIGSPHVSLGMHEDLTVEQIDSTWFWTVPGNRNPEDPETRALAVRRLQELADHAAQVGVDLSLETYEGTYLGSADGAVEFITDIDRDNVGVNPDLGNLIRAQEPIEAWEAMTVKLLPYANYWHVKNYSRAENPVTGSYFSVPSSLAGGLINYRKAVRYAIAHGFRGAFLCENYGGDGLAVTAEHQRYLRELLRTTA
jgi:sugar phosphate isomerase/epimerase